VPRGIPNAPTEAAKDQELIPVTLEWIDGTSTAHSQVVMMPRNANGRFVFTQNYDTTILVEWVDGPIQ